MRSKLYTGPIISCSTKCTTGFRFYPTSDSEHYQLTRLHYFVLKTNKLQRVYDVISRYQGECMMWSCGIIIAFIISKFYWIRSSCVIKNVIDNTKMSSMLYYYVHHLISHYILHDWQSKLMNIINNTFIILHISFVLPTSESIYLKNLYYSKYLQYGPKFDPSISNYMWPHVSDTKSDHNIHVLQMRTWIIFFLLLCDNFPLTLNMGRC